MENYNGKQTFTNASLEMNDNLGSENSSIIIENNDSEINRFYRMDVPFNLSIEYCSGGTASSYVNSITLSVEKEVLYQQTVENKNRFYDTNIPHYHDFYEFLLVLDGSLTLRIEGIDYEYHAGSCYLLNRGLYHLEHYTSNCQIMFLGISPEYMSQLFEDAKNSIFYQEKQICNSKLYQFIENDRKHPGAKSYLDFIPTVKNQKNYHFIHNLAETMMNTLLYPTFGTASLIKGQISSFLSYLASDNNFYCTDVSINNSGDFLLFARITRIFEENDGRISRTDLETILNYSGGHLNRIVNKYTGMCLYDYGINFALKKAAKKLTESKDSIQSIAAQLQFTNRTHFYQLFKNKYGVTPKEYREMFAQN